MGLSHRIARSFLPLALLTGLLAGLTGPRVLDVGAAPQLQTVTHIVISQVYGGGGNSSAPYQNDYIELFNPTDSAVLINGWSVQYAASTGSSWEQTVLSGEIQPGQYYLIQEAAGAGCSGSPCGVNLPTPDVPSGSISMSATSGKVALVNNSILLSGTCPSGLVDFVGYGSANCNEGSSPAPALSNTTVALRNVDGCSDTNDNNADFTAGTPTPRNTSSPLTLFGYSPLALLINEVAWSGTAANTGHEWIELYNPGTTDINLSDGWTLKSSDNTPSINLSGVIPAGGYFLLERDENAVFDIAANQIYIGALADSGESFTLYDPSSNVIDTANGDGGGWPAGNSSNHATMERIGTLADDDTSWFTNNGVMRNGVDANEDPIWGTPKSTNSLTPTLSPTITLSPTLTKTPTRTPTPTGTIPTPTRTATPTFTVIINEVAWMGTLASSSDEWIELYNPGSSSVNLSGWQLNASDGSPSISLSGIISAGGFFVIAASSSVFNDLTPDVTFSGTLSNEGEVLKLIDASSVVADIANSDSGAWPAGVGSPTYATMERRGVTADNFFAWSTYANSSPPPYPDPLVHDRNGNVVKGTPGQANWGPTVTLTPTATSTPTRTQTPTRTRTPLPTAKPAGRPIINEFLPRPGFDWNQDGRIDVFDEFIEIQNIGPIDINISGWTLDDEAGIGSSPFTLPSINLKPGQRAVFYGLETNILLSDGGDSVRLMNPNGVIFDAYTYGIVKVVDESWCRLPEGRDWWDDCVPTPGLLNTRQGRVPSMPPGNGLQAPLCQLPDTLPADFLFAECNGFGTNIWSSKFWDGDGWQGDQFVPENTSKWESFVE